MIMKLPLKTSIAGLMLTSAIVAVSLVTLPSAGTHADGPASAPPPPSVSVAVVEASGATIWDNFSGRLEAVERVDVRSRVAGTVHQVHFREGALVKAGDLLVTIDPAPYAAEVERLEAQVAAAESRVQFTKTEVERGRKLLGTSTLSERDVDQRLNAYREAEANLRAAKAALQTASLNLDWTEVRAPVAGRVGRLEITTGNVIAAGPGAPVLTTIVSVDPIYASFNADETVVARALASLSAEAHASGNVGTIPVEIASAAMDGDWTRGHLQLIDNQIDAASGTVRTRAVFANPDGRLIPGQFVRVRMARPANGPVVAVTERAVGTDQNKRFVIVVDDNNKTAYREVSLGAMAGSLRIVTAGLSTGERIIVNGLQRVRPGDVVTPEITSMDGMRTTAAHADQSPSRIAQH
jgi:multidrug efflux system membrane fusion protein